MPRRSDKLWSEISDESSFYGNEEEISELEKLVRDSAVVSSSSKSKQKSKSKTKMSSAEPDSDAEAISSPRERPSRKKRKERVSTSTDSKTTSNVKNRSSKKETKGSRPASGPAKTPRTKKSRAEDQQLTESDASAPEPPKKKSSAKKRKSDSPEPAASDSAPPPQKKPVRKAESPESTDSGSPSPSPPREQPPKEAREPETNEADESTEDPDESSSDNDKPSGSPDEAEIALPLSNVDPIGRRRASQPMSDLIASMPPSTTNMRDDGPWIYVRNPHYKSLKGPDATSFSIEVTETILGGHDPDTGMPMRRLGGKGSSTEMARTRQILERNILELATRKGIVMGKWMFFLSQDRLDYAWNLIAKATERGELGPAAKVATDDGSDRARLIAVYTMDFNDIADVKRVVLKLVELGLVKPREKPIFYKTDAYTYLDINSKNPWGLKASLYNSKDILARRV